MNVLVIQKESPIRDYLEFVLSKNDTINITSTDSIKFSLSHLSNNKNLGMIFIGNKVNVDAGVQDLICAIKEYSEENGTILSGSNKGLQKSLAENYIHPMSPIDTLIKKLGNIMDLEKDEFSSNDFIPIPTSFCYKFVTLPCDIHLKIGKGDTAKYIKRFSGNTEIDFETIQDYINKDLAKVYVHRSDIDKLDDHFNNAVSPDTADTHSLVPENPKIENFFDVLNESIDYSAYVVNEMGLVNLDPKKAEQVSMNIKNEILNLSQSRQEQLEEIFKKSFQSEGNIDIKVNALTSVIATNILQRVSWGSSEMMEKVAYAATFHNIALHGDAKLISCITQEEFYDLESEEQTLVKKHASYAANTLKSLDFTPHEVEKIILEQHGSRRGDTFPETRENTSKLAALFRIVSEFSTQLIKEYETNPITFSANQVLINEYKRTDGSKYKDIFEVIQKCIPKM